MVLAIDPGPAQSAFIVLDGLRPLGFNILPNEILLEQIRRGAMERTDGVRLSWSSVVIEKVEGFGMPVGAEVFETVYWSGQFAEAARPSRVDRIGRKAVKITLCGSMKAKDPNIRQALIDRYGGPDAIRKGGPLHGVSKDVWSALAVAVTWTEQQP